MAVAPTIDRSAFPEFDLESSVPISSDPLGAARIEAEQTFEFDLESSRPIGPSTETYFHEERGKIFKAEAGLTGPQFDNRIRRGIDGVPSNRFFGLLDIGPDFVNAAPKGAVRFFIGLPQAKAGLDKATGELLEVELNKELSSSEKRFLEGEETLFDEMRLAIIRGFGLFDPAALSPLGRAKLIKRANIRSGALDFGRSDRIQEAADKVTERNRRYVEASGIERPEGFAGFLFDIGGAGASLVTALGFTVVTRDVSLAAVFFGMLQQSSIYQEARAAGLSVLESNKAAELAGVLEAGLEFIGLTYFTKALRLSKPINVIGLSIANEMLQEGSQTGAEAGVARFFGIRNDTLIEIIKDIFYSALIGGVTGGGVSVVSVGGRKVLGRRTDAERAETGEIDPDAVRDKLVEELKDKLREAGVSEEDLEGDSVGEIVTRIEKKVGERQEEITEEIAKIIEDTADPITIDPETEAQSAEVIEKFQDGVDIPGPVKNAVDRAQAAQEAVSGAEAAQEAAEGAEAAGVSPVGQEELEKAQAKETKAAKLAEERGQAFVAKEEITPGPLSRERLSENLVKLAKSIEANDQAVAKTEKSIEAWEAKAKAKKLTKAVKKTNAAGLAKAKARLEEQLVRRAELQAKHTVTQELAERDALGSVELRAETLDDLEVEDTAARTKVAEKGITQGFRDGKTLAKKDAAAAQQAVKNIIDKFVQEEGVPTEIDVAAIDLEKAKKKRKKTEKDAEVDVAPKKKEHKLKIEGKGAFLEDLKKLNTAKKLEKGLPKLEAKINKAIEKARKKQIKEGLTRALKTTSPTIQSGKPKGKITPELHDLFEDVRKANKLQKTEAAEKLEERLAPPESDKKAVFDSPTPRDRLINQILAIRAASDQLNADEMEHTLLEVKALISGGKAIVAAGAKAKSEGLKVKSEKLLSHIPSEQVDRVAVKARMVSQLRELRGAASAAFNGWLDTLDIILGTTKEGHELAKKLAADTSAAFQKVKGVARTAHDTFTAGALEAFEFETEKQLVKQFRADSAVKTIGTFTNTRGETVKLQLSKAEARKRVMEFRDPTLRETLTSESGNAYSQDMIDALEGDMSSQDWAFIDSQMAFYKEFYKAVNEVYRRIYGVNLPFNEFYSPISRKVARGAVTDEFLQEIQFRGSAAPGGVKSRVGSKKPLLDMSDIETMQRHIIEMSHFIAFGEHAQELNAIFGDSIVQSAIEQRFGKNMKDSVNGFLMDFTRGHVKRSQGYMQIFDWIRKNYTTSVLGLKPALAAKQTVSVLSYLEFMPAKDYAEGMVTFWANPKANIAKLDDSDFFKNRGPNISLEIADVSRSNEVKQLRKFGALASFRNAQLVFVRLGDKAAIGYGGAVYYNYLRKQGWSHKKALSEFDRVSSLTQQSSDLDQLSALQRENAFVRLATMFMSAPNAYFRREISALRNWKRGNLPKRELIKKLIIYHFLLPALFQFVSDGFKVDPKKQIRALVAGSFNGMFIFADGIQQLAAWIADEEDTFRRGGLVTVFDDMWNEIIGGTKDIMAGDIYEGIKDLMGVLGKGTGLAIEQGFNFVEGAHGLVTGDDIEERVAGFLLMTGWPPSAARVKEGEKGGIRSQVR